jgi:hypothetical protein
MDDGGARELAPRGCGLGKTIGAPKFKAQQFPNTDDSFTIANKGERMLGSDPIENGSYGIARARNAAERFTGISHRKHPLLYRERAAFQPNSASQVSEYLSVEA